MKEIAPSFLILYLALITTLACGEFSQQPSDAEENANARKAVIAELSARYNADADWIELFDEPMRFHVHTVELQRALIKPDASPVIIEAILDDIIALPGDKYEVTAYTWAAFQPTLHLQLRCSGPELSELFNRTPSFFDEFAFVARITALHKPMFQASAEDSYVDEFSVPDLVIESANIVIAVGECLDAVSLDQ